MNRFELDAEWIVTKGGGKIPLFDRTIRVDLNGASLSQHILDVTTAAANEVAGPVNIMFCRVGTAYGGVPRLIADRGEIYDALAELLAERDTILLDSQSDLS